MPENSDSGSNPLKIPLPRWEGSGEGDCGRIQFSPSPRPSLKGGETDFSASSTDLTHYQNSHLMISEVCIFTARKSEKNCRTADNSCLFVQIRG